MVTTEDAIKIINEANPFMGSLLNCEESLLDYCKAHITKHVFLSEHLKRQEPYKVLIKEKIDQLFMGDKLNINFNEGLILDTSDHHGILNFPSTVGAHLITRFDTIFDRKDMGDYFVMNCGNVPFFDAINKRGVKINGKQLNLYPKTAKNKLVSRYPLYKYDLMEWIYKSDNIFSEEEINYFQKLQGIIDGIDFSQCKKVSDQIVKINYKVWLEMFDAYEIDNVRRCITLEHDEILIKFLSKFLLENENNIVWKLLFEKEFRSVILNEFKGIYGAWDYAGKQSGTHFFWGFNQNDGNEYRLELQEDTFVSPDRKIRDVKLTPEDVTCALNEGILIPSIFTKFTTVAFYLGAKICGGPGQTEYTEKMRRAWLRTIDSYYREESDLAKNWSILNFNCADVAFKRLDDGRIFKEWGMDVAMNHTFSRSYIDKIGKIPFKYFIYPMIPISYFRLTPADKRGKLEASDEILYQGFKNL